MGIPRLAVDPPAITKASSPRGYPMRLVEFESNSSRFSDVAECMFGGKLACKPTTDSSHKSFWFK